MTKNILWDFDGVILNSMKVRDLGFEKIFASFEPNQVDKLLKFHRENGGLSRYVKIRYFFEKILGESISEGKVMEYASEFSAVMKKMLGDKNLLIEDSMNFINENHKKYNFHIVSGSDQEELRFLCQQLGIAHFFLSIHGSPTPKKELVYQLMEKHAYLKEETCLIGDSVNDFEAASENGLHFYGYNNDDLLHLKTRSQTYIKNFREGHVFN